MVPPPRNESSLWSYNVPKASFPSLQESDCIENKYDLIVTNPPIRAGKEIVTKILVESKKYLNLNGEIWVVIQKKQGAPSAKKNLESVFKKVDIVKRDKGYYILRAINL